VLRTEKTNENTNWELGRILPGRQKSPARAFGDRTRAGSWLVMSFYPPTIRRWINARGGLTPRLIGLRRVVLSIVASQERSAGSVSAA
jgi:hypothetical protein